MFGITKVRVTMKFFKNIFHCFLVVIILNAPNSLVYAKNIPSSFADLAEKLMPSVVNIASTQTIKTTSNPFKNFQLSN